MSTTTQSLTGTTTRDLVFLVQDWGMDAAAAENQLLSANGALIGAAAAAFPTLRSAPTIARDAFREAIRTCTFSDNNSLTTYCWSAMSSALQTARRAAVQPVQVDLIMDDAMTAVPIPSADLGLARRIAQKDEAASRATAMISRLNGAGSFAGRYGISA